MMQANWNQEQLNLFSDADDLYISPFYSDGETPGTPTWIWSVVVDNALYVRAYNGQRSRWYQSAVEQNAGKIQIAGQKYDVEFQSIEDDPALTDLINQAYRKKYGNSDYLSPMLKEGPVSATVQIAPRKN